MAPITLKNCMPGDKLRDGAVIAVGTDSAGRRVVFTGGETFGGRPDGAPFRIRKAYAVRLGITPDGTAAGGCCLFYAHVDATSAYAKARECFDRYTLYPVLTA